MAETSKPQTDEVQKQIFDKLANNDTDSFKQLIGQVKGGVNFVDENGMTPLQHACCKGNKDAVQILLDMVSTDRQSVSPWSSGICCVRVCALV